MHVELTHRKAKEGSLRYRTVIEHWHVYGYPCGTIVSYP